MNLLAVDIGNTNITMGIYGDRSLLAIYRITTASKRTSDEYGIIINQFLQQENLKPIDINDTIISSVVPKIMHSFVNAIKHYLNKEPLIVGPGIKTGISIRIDNPKELGADRLVCASGAHSLYQRDTLVVDFGTATTFDYVTAKGEYRGGSIAPGLEIMAQALTASTAKLPEVEIIATASIIGTNTIDAIQSGLFYGYLGLVKEIITASKAQVSSDLYVVATGGLGKFVYENCNLIDEYNGSLIFTGLLNIYLKNKPLL